MEDSCKECRFSGRRQNYDEWPCKRRAPVAEQVDSCRDTRIWVPRWPIMAGRDWCGEFERATHPKD